MHSSYSLDYILRLPIKNISRLLTKAYETKHEKKAWDLYVSVYSNMTEETHIPFSEFYNPTKHTNNVELREKTIEEIMLEVKDTLNTFNGGENNRNI